MVHVRGFLRRDSMAGYRRQVSLLPSSAAGGWLRPVRVASTKFTGIARLMDASCPFSQISAEQGNAKQLYLLLKALSQVITSLVHAGANTMRELPKKQAEEVRRGALSGSFSTGVRVWGGVESARPAQEAGRGGAQMWIEEHAALPADSCLKISQQLANHAPVGRSTQVGSLFGQSDVR